MENTYNLKLFRNNRGYVGSIIIDMVMIEDTNLIIEFDEHLSIQWRNAIEFGCKYFYEHSGLQYKKGLKVYVEGLKTLTGDTTYMIVFYITIMCISEILQLPIELVKIDENGYFVCMR